MNACIFERCSSFSNAFSFVEMVLTKEIKEQFDMMAIFGSENVGIAEKGCINLEIKLGLRLMTRFKICAFPYCFSRFLNLPV